MSMPKPKTLKSHKKASLDMQQDVSRKYVTDY